MAALDNFRHSLTRLPGRGLQAVWPVIAGRSARLRVACGIARQPSAENVAARKRRTGRGKLPADFEKDAPTAFRKASALQTITSARVKLDAALLLYTSQPQLCLLPADTLAGKIADLANALGWSYADAAELLTRNAALADFLPYRLRAQAEAVRVALGVDLRTALVAVGNRPALLDASPLQLKQQLDGLCSELKHLPASAVAAMAAAEPRLFDLAPGAAAARLGALASLLEVTVGEAGQLAAAQPALLLPAADTVKANFEAALQLCTLTRAKLQSWARAAPLLLLLPADTLRGHLDALGPGVLRCQLLWKDVVQYVDTEPAILCASPQQLQERLQELPALLHSGTVDALHCARKHPSYLAYDSAVVGSVMGALAAALQLSPVQAAMLAREPELLWHQSPQTLLPKVSTLATATGAPYPDVAATVAAKPALLLLTAGQLTEAVEALKNMGFKEPSGLLDVLALPRPPAKEIPQAAARQMSDWAAALRLSLAEMRRLVVQQPRILDSSVTGAEAAAALGVIASTGVLPDLRLHEFLLSAPQALELPDEVLLRSCRMLRAAGAASALWREEMARLTPAKLAKYLLQYPRMDRLKFLKAVGAEDSVPLAFALEKDAAAFHRRFPEFGDWAARLEAHRRKNGAKGKAARKRGPVGEAKGPEGRRMESGDASLRNEPRDSPGSDGSAGAEDDV